MRIPSYKTNIQCWMKKMQEFRDLQGFFKKYRNSNTSKYNLGRFSFFPCREPSIMIPFCSKPKRVKYSHIYLTFFTIWTTLLAGQLGYHIWLVAKPCVEKVEKIATMFDTIDPKYCCYHCHRSQGWYFS